MVSLPGSDMPVPGAPVVVRDSSRIEPDLTRHHSMHYVTSTPRSIANSYMQRYGVWPKYIAYPPNVSQIDFDRDLAWLEERHIVVIRCSAAKNWVYAGPTP